MGHSEQRPWLIFSSSVMELYMDLKGMKEAAHT